MIAQNVRTRKDLAQLIVDVMSCYREEIALLDGTELAVELLGREDVTIRVNGHEFQLGTFGPTSASE